MIKKILLNSNLLEEIIAEKRCFGNQIQTLKPNDNAKNIQLTRNSFDDADLDNLAMKLQAIILNNEEFMNQIKKVTTETISGALSETKPEFQKHNTKQNDEISKLHDKCDELKLYSMRNCLVVHGLAEYQNENTGLMIKKFLWDKLEVKVDEMGLDRSHRLKRTNII